MPGAHTANRGVFKGWIDIYSEADKANYDKWIDNKEDLSFLTITAVTIRLYILKILNIV